MKRKFWILIIGSLFLPLALLGLGGLYFFKDQRKDHLQQQARIYLKTTYSFYEQILNQDEKNLSKDKSESKKRILPLLNSVILKNSINQNIFVLSEKGQILFPKNFTADYPIWPLKKSLERNRSIKSEWFVKMNRKNNKDSILFYIKEWNSSNLFLITKRNIKNPVLFQSKASWLWFGVCGLFALFIFSLLFLIIHPLFFAYESLKSVFIYLGKTGTIPSWLDYSKNSFLYFYKNWSFLVCKRRNRSEQEDFNPVTNKTFQDVAEEEILKLKEKFPHISIKWNIKSDIKLWGFSYFMKRILHELFLNSLESMGGSKNPELIVSAWEKEDQFIFSIQDKGCGLLDEDLEKIFKLYYSTKSQLGVGLNIVQSLVSSNSGKVELYPLLKGKGSEVKVSLPLKCFLQIHFKNNESYSDLDQKENSDLKNSHWREEFCKNQLENKPSYPS